MRHYLFILGRDPALSVLEIASYLARKEVPHALVAFDEEVCVVLLDERTNVTSLILALGGTVKIARKMDSLNEIVVEKNKMTYSVLAMQSDPSQVLEQLRDLFKQERVKAMRRYGSLEEIPPSKSKRLDLEIVVYKNVPYRVVAISDPKEYRARDAKRPAFDPLKETSIRLAKILVNLSRARGEIFDPFCGTGTILQEALLMGHSVIGMDTSIDAAKKNIAWLGEQYAKKAKLLKGDARHASQQVRTAEAIATEPYLGPYLKKNLEKHQALRITSQLESLYCDFLKNVHSIVQGKIVMIIPRFKTTTGVVALDLGTILRDTGYRLSSPVAQIQLPLLYRHRMSRIERLIYILEKV